MPHADPVAGLEYQKAYREKNRSSLRAKGKIQDARRDKETKRARSKAWADKHREEIRLKSWIKQGYPAPTRPRRDFFECCGKPPEGRSHLHLDHDHVTGRFRGWLCRICNMAIGQLGDSLEGVRKAIAYLER